MQLNEYPTTHCLKVPKVFDQANNSITVKLGKTVHLKKKGWMILYAVIFVSLVEKWKSPRYGQHMDLAKSEVPFVLILKEDVEVH